MNDIDQNWWNIINQMGSGQAQAPSGLGSQLMDYMQTGGLDQWLNNPRTPGSGGTPQPTPMPQAPAPQAQAPMPQAQMDPYRQLQAQGYAMIPGQGMVTMDPRMWSGPMSKGVGANPDNKTGLYDARNDADWEALQKIKF